MDLAAVPIGSTECGGSIAKQSQTCLGSAGAASHSAPQSTESEAQKLCPFYNSNFNVSAACHAASSGHLGEDYSPERGGPGEGSEERRRQVAITVISHSCRSVPAQKGRVICHSVARHHGTKGLDPPPLP